MHQSLQEKYYQLLRRYVTQPQEKHSAEAAELGRELVLADVPPEELGELHEKAIRDLAPAFPDIEPLNVVRMVSTPITSVLTAYGLAFRQLHEKLGKGAKVALQEGASFIARLLYCIIVEPGIPAPPVIIMRRRKSEYPYCG